MSFIKQPQLVVEIPVKVFRERADGEIGVFFSQTLGPVYQWKSKQAPSGVVMWEATETNRIAQEFTEITSDMLPETLYETLKLFYIGKSVPVVRG